MYKFIRLFSSRHEDAKKNINNLITILAKLINNDMLLYDIRLVTSELIANGIEHGNCMDESCAIYLEIEMDKNYIYIRVEDEGCVAYDLNVDYPDDCKIRGRGLFIVSQIAEQVNTDGHRIEAKIARAW